MKHRRLDSNWDYTFGQGVSNYLSGVEAVAQAIRTRLLLLYGEWWEDQEDGLPLFEQILGARGSGDGIKAVDLLIRDRITGTEGVQSITDYESSYSNRKYTFEATVETIYGTVTVSNT